MKNGKNTQILSILKVHLAKSSIWPFQYMLKLGFPEGTCQFLHKLVLHFYPDHAPSPEDSFSGYFVTKSIDSYVPRWLPSEQLGRALINAASEVAWQGCKCPNMVESKVEKSCYTKQSAVQEGKPARNAMQDKSVTNIPVKHKWKNLYWTVLSSTITHGTTL